MTNENGASLAVSDGERRHGTRFQLDGLRYIATFSVDEFKALTHCEVLEVVAEHGTASSCFTYGDNRGAVAVEHLPCDPVVSVVVNGSGAIFALLHEAEDTGKTSFEGDDRVADEPAAEGCADDVLARDDEDWTSEQVVQVLTRCRCLTKV